MPTKPTKRTAKFTTPKPSQGINSGPADPGLQLRLAMQQLGKELQLYHRQLFWRQQIAEEQNQAANLPSQRHELLLRQIRDRLFAEPQPEPTPAPSQQVELLQQIRDQLQSQQPQLPQQAELLQQVLAQLQSPPPQLPQQVELLQQIRDQLQSLQPQPQTEAEAKAEAEVLDTSQRGAWFQGLRTDNPKKPHDTHGQWGARLWTDHVTPDVKVHLKRKTFMRRFQSRNRS